MPVINEVEILRAACCMAGLDGVVVEEEMALLRQLAQKAGVGRVSLQAMIDRAKTDHDFYQEQFRFVTADPASTMATIFGVAVADGELSSDQRVVLQVFSQRLGLSQEKFDKLLAAAEKYLERKRASGEKR